MLQTDALSANVLIAPSGRTNSEFHVKVGAFVWPFKKNFSAHPISILYMNALVNASSDGIPPSGSKPNKR